jgi:TolB protein
MLRRARVTLAAVALGWLAMAGPSHAQSRLDITQGVRDAVPIAVVPFGGQAEGAATDVANVIAGDLRLSGRFAPLERQDMVARPTSGAEIRFQDWRLLKSDFIVVGRVEPDGAGSAVAFELFNVQTGQSLLAQRLPVGTRGLRATSHQIADMVFERLTGIPGAFSTRIAYVTVEGRPPSQRYRLVVADADGFSPRTVTESAEPIMSPAWSPDGTRLAYVSFESKLSAIICSGSPRAHADAYRPAPASTARRPFHRMDASSQSPFRAMATWTSTRSTWPRRR